MKSPLRVNAEFKLEELTDLSCVMALLGLRAKNSLQKSLSHMLSSSDETDALPE